MKKKKVEIKYDPGTKTAPVDEPTPVVPEETADENLTEDPGE